MGGMPKCGVVDLPRAIFYQTLEQTHTRLLLIDRLRENVPGACRFSRNMSKKLQVLGSNLVLSC